MSLIPIFVFTGGVISATPIVLFVVVIIELICYIKGRSESVPKAKLRKHLYCMIICLALFVIMIAVACIVLRYV
ncbi:MAG: hypothetical protein J5817_04085 [Treponema sp.]|nr:hypothetical protein [Treponema sp.]